MKDFLIKNWLGLVAIVISVGTWLSFWLRFSPFTWDSFSVMATTMGVIVTFLVGFQIWTVIDNKEFKKEVKAEQKEVKDTLQSVVYQELINQFIINFEFSMVYNEIGRNLSPYLKFALQTIQLGLSCNQIEKCNLVIKGMLEVIENSSVEFTNRQHSMLLDIFYNIKIPDPTSGLNTKGLEYVGERIRKATII
ncbi:hypothetical protein [uncultured Capnocytophaga sp.]|uniref:hypothetical protein n=1 Tax=uncultured Capnocytophaga sp. TaxID=159273 RepID=UPI0028E5A8AC|nr:hypothetical protein [uncultured Capnocytophaga sp.]